MPPAQGAQYPRQSRLTDPHEPRPNSSVLKEIGETGRQRASTSKRRSNRKKTRLAHRKRELTKNKLMEGVSIIRLLLDYGAESRKRIRNTLEESRDNVIERALEDTRENFRRRYMPTNEEEIGIVSNEWGLIKEHIKLRYTNELITALTEINSSATIWTTQLVMSGSCRNFSDMTSFHLYKVSTHLYFGNLSSRDHAEISA